MFGWVFLTVLLVLVYLVVPVFAFVAMGRSGRNRDEIARLAAALAAALGKLDTLEADIRALRASPEPPTSAGPAADAGDFSSEPSVEDVPEAPPPEDSSVGADAGPAPVSPQEASVSAPAWAGSEQRARLEESLTSRWMVWLGAATIALGGAFLVKYSVEQGWVGPATRTMLGFLLGVALVAGGEWLRRRPLQKALAAVRPDNVPPALAAAGLFICFASLYAAYALYGLLSPLVAFFALAGVAIVAVGLALLQGWLVALVGLVGGFVTPALVQSQEPSAWVLFSYLIVIEVACLAVARYMVWWWYVAAILTGAAIWPLIWFVSAWRASDVYPLGIYLLALGAIIIGFRRVTGPLFDMQEDGAPGVFLWGRTGADLFTVLVSATVALLMFALLRMANYDSASLVFLFVLCAMYLTAGWRNPALDLLAPVAAAAALLAMVSWHLHGIVVVKDVFSVFVPVFPPGVVPFVTVETGFGVLFGIGGFAALWRAQRPAVWAGVSAATVPMLFAIAYWRVLGFGLDWRWATVALVLAAAALAAATAIARNGGGRNLMTPLGYYAAATAALIGLGMTMTLQNAWLSAALAIELPALGLIALRVPSRELRWLAGFVAAVVLARLALNPNVFDYALGSHPAFGWVLYGYVLPALAFWWAARLFQGTGEDALVTVLDAGALVFCVLFISSEIRISVAGSLVGGRYGLAEQSLHTIAWLSIAYVLRLRDRAAPTRVAYWGSRILLGAAVAQLVGLQLILSNPMSAYLWYRATGASTRYAMFARDAVGDYPVVNLLFIAYAVPAAYVVWFANEFRKQAKPIFAGALDALGFVLAFAYISLEVRRAFQGPVLSATHHSAGEFYAYSVVWLVYALSLLGLGIWFRKSALRYASLVVLLLTVIKVFLFDMADLEGLLRAASFLGLGLCLVGIGYIYQRFVFPRRV